MPRYKVAVCEDDKFVADVVKQILESDEQIEVVGVAYDGKTLMANIENWQPDVVLMDLRLKEDLSGVYYIEQMRKLNLKLGILVWTSYQAHDVELREALKAGINGYFFKGRDYLKIWDKVKAVARGEFCFSPEIAELITPMQRAKQA